MCAQLLAGAAKIVITPPVGLDLCGFGNRPGPSTSVHDDLCAAALYLESDQQALIITCDLIGLDRESVREVRAGIQAATGVASGSIMIGCSHTHSGPATPCIAGLGKIDADYLAVLKRKLVGLGKMAHDSRQPCALGTLREPVSVGINRREMREAGMTIGRNERGLTAPWVDVVAVDTMDGRPLARYFVHAAHAVTLSGLEISADWPGYAQRIVERVYGDGCVAMFGQGCCGNINSEPRGTFDIAEAQGRVMAGAVVKAAEYALKQAEVEIACASVDLALPCFDPPPVAEAQAQVEAFRQAAAGPERNYGLRMMDAGDIAWAERLLALAQAGATNLTRPYEVQAMRLGDLLLVGLPGEVFVEYALQIDEGAPQAQTATMAYANDNVGYVPTAAAYAEGGYEVTQAIRFYGDTMLRPESERMIVAAALELSRSLR
jgi:neutral ceramidase